jgi:2-isopropylmalate synthase
MSDDAPRSIEIYDTTLRDGSQLEGISLTVEDKLRIAEQLDWLGVHYIEAGWPGANPKDDEMFGAHHRADVDTSIAVAFGSTAAPEGQGRLRRHAPASAWRQARRRCASSVSRWTTTSPSPRHHARRGVAMVADSIEFLRGNGLEVFFDAEHFFEWLPAHARVQLARARSGGRDAGATRLVLCDTNGGTLPDEVERTVLRRHLLAPT